ncbi:NADPH:quinone reductase [Streptomyces sp. CB00455]|nr:NADP-dependent oxidoreductase [Streptomyces sp. CB00455]OKK11915.1 NADPH:quinone reductase [Streptomyces sp. CB00455]
MPSAITYTRFGGPEVLTFSEVDMPQPAAHEVRVRVRAAAVNPLDNKIRRGELAGVFPAEFPITPGMDVAGVVDAVGDAVSGIALGDEVFGVATGGAYAQYALLGGPVVKPQGLSWEVAAALATVGETAFRALKHLDVRGGQTLLIHGAAGSVGAIAVQLAVARGVTVIGTAGAADLERVTGLGATAVLYGDGMVERVRAAAPQGIDAVLDTSGAGVLPQSIELAGGPERVITLADMSAAQYGVRFTGMDPSDRAPEALPELAELAAAGKLTVPIWRTYPLAEAARAHADIDTRRNRGKIVLLP